MSKERIEWIVMQIERRIVREKNLNLEGIFELTANFSGKTMLAYLCFVLKQRMSMRKHVVLIRNFLIWSGFSLA